MTPTLPVEDKTGISSGFPKIPTSKTQWLKKVTFCDSPVPDKDGL
jgi:hypothetical protein